MWIAAKARLANHLIQNAWEATLANGETSTPWSWADTWPVARLRHASTDTDLIVLEGADGSSLAFGPGHQSGTDAPGTGVSLIGGHRDTHFGFLKEVQLRDELLVQTTTGDWQRYEVTNLAVVDSEAAPLSLPAEGDLLVLVTCYPFDNWLPGGPMRYIVEAVPVNLEHPIASVSTNTLSF